MFDTIIVGTGPAGFTAAIYAARRTMKTLVIGKEIGGQLAWATEIENYPGFKSISAFDLVNKFHEQVTALGVEVKNETVLNIEKKDDFFIIRTSLGEFSTKTIILTLGLSPRTLGVPGEVELTGRGVCYCANCDAPFFKNKSVIVVGGGNCALDAADVAVVFYSPDAVKIKRLEEVSYDQISQSFQREDLIIYTNPTEFKDFLFSQNLDNFALLLMSSGNYGGLNFDEVKGLIN